MTSARRGRNVGSKVAWVVVAALVGATAACSPGGTRQTTSVDTTIHEAPAPSSPPPAEDAATAAATAADAAVAATDAAAGQGGSSTPPTGVAALIIQWTALDARCRQGPDDDADTIAACDRRELLEPRIVAQGFCRSGAPPTRWRTCD